MRCLSLSLSALSLSRVVASSSRRLSAVSIYPMYHSHYVMYLSALSLLSLSLSYSRSSTKAHKTRGIIWCCDPLDLELREHLVREGERAERTCSTEGLSCGASSRSARRPPSPEPSPLRSVEMQFFQRLEQFKLQCIGSSFNLLD